MTEQQMPAEQPREPWLAQYLADLEVLERCEQCIVEQAGCPDFFGCMGEIARGRAA